MASIHRRGERWEVRHRCSITGKNRSQTAPNRAAARARQQQIEAAILLSQPCCAPAADGAPRRIVTLAEGLAAFVRAKARAVSPGRLVLVDRACALLLEAASARWRCAPEVVPLAALERETLGGLYDHLVLPRAEGGRGNALLTAGQRLRDAEAAWRWLADEYPHDVAPVRTLDVPAGYVQHTPQCASWAVLDQPVLYALASGRPRRYVAGLLVQRHTGLRMAQARRLRRGDLDTERAELVIRPADEKRGQGRTIPVSAHLVADLERLGLPDEALPTVIGAEPDEPWCDGVIRAVWAECGVDPAAWKGAPGKAFRASFTTHLLAAGTPLHVVKMLVGHRLSSDVTLGSYTDYRAMMPAMREAVASVPAVAWPMFAKKVSA